ncbi:hypothetical protein [Xanthomarina sp. F2636L]|uniref:hypothetical protein n=1 Tax=Xanthomarina sp. F2636L TaxID=2996018 RepID=UPI00225E1CD3|nr:hypothetical protein [Xanthomarina sp. F2636L]MCX7549734.1 hypothetical protein [Xanthomarina sp. F2636L]
MQEIKQHIIFRIISILLVVFVLMPSAFKLSHAFSHNHHKHEVCLGEAQAHLHTLDIDCEFQKFQLNTAFNLPEYTYEFLEKAENHQVINSQYFFISEFQKLHFSLRGPPFNS